jgi:T-complex protein 1 subunit theta
MVINHLDKLFVTSDAATIIRELEVVHPAGKVLVMASQQQEHEVSTRSRPRRFLVVMSASSKVRG